MDLFIQSLFVPQERFGYLAWILVVVVSIVLHELAHGWAAIRHGDDTPLRMGRMTGNPLVHMGPFSLMALLIMGMAWGQMPIDPTRLRGRYAQASVAAAGPFTNLLIALVSLVSLGLLIRFDLLPPDETWAKNLRMFLWVAGTANIVLMVFNLMPVPPLDGSHILANFSRPYASFIGDPDKQGAMMLGFVAVFALSGALWPYADQIAFAVVDFVAYTGS